MDANRFFRCSPATRDVEVVTARTEEGTFITVIHNGPLDGESFPAETMLGSLVRHKHALELAKLAAKEEER